MRCKNKLNEADNKNINDVEIPFTMIITKLFITINDHLFAILDQLGDLHFHYLWILNDACVKHYALYTF